jgi:hypothetical protein
VGVHKPKRLPLTLKRVITLKLHLPVLVLWPELLNYQTEAKWPADITAIAGMTKVNHISALPDKTIDNFGQR